MKNIKRGGKIYGPFQGCVNKKEVVFRNVLLKLPIFLTVIFSLTILPSLLAFQNLDNSLEDYSEKISFEVKILDFESPVKLGEFLEFTYLIKGISGIHDNVKINFWVEKQGVIITSGSNTIYVRNLEEKVESTKIFLPESVESGIYNFILEVAYGDYHIDSHRTIQVNVQNNLVKITTAEGKVLNIYLISALIGLITFVLFLIFFLERKKIKKNFLQQEKWIKKHKIFLLTLFLFIILGVLMYYLNFFEKITKGILKLILRLRINILPYFKTPSIYYILGIILVLIILISLGIIIRKKKLFNKFKIKLKKKKIKGIKTKKETHKLLKQKHKTCIKKRKIKFKKSQNKLIKKLKNFLKQIKKKRKIKKEKLLKQNNS